MVVLWNSGGYLMKIKMTADDAITNSNSNLFLLFQKCNLYLPRNLPQKFHRSDLVLIPSYSLLKSFCWNSLNKRNVFDFAEGSVWKLKNGQKDRFRHFSNLEIGIWLSIFSIFFGFFLIRYSKSWIDSVKKSFYQNYLSRHLQGLNFHWKLGSFSKRVSENTIFET